VLLACLLFQQVWLRTRDLDRQALKPPLVPTLPLQGFHTDEVFEQRVMLMVDKPSRRLGQKLAGVQPSGGSATGAKWKEVLKTRHR
jgi:hypothetical protein